MHTVYVFESAAVIAFQSVCHSEIHQNNVILLFKNYFKNTKTYINFKQKNSKIFRIAN